MRFNFSQTQNPSDVKNQRGSDKHYVIVLEGKTTTDLILNWNNKDIALSKVIRRSQFLYKNNV